MLSFSRVVVALVPFVLAGCADIDEDGVPSSDEATAEATAEAGTTPPPYFVVQTTWGGYNVDQLWIGGCKNDGVTLLDGDMERLLVDTGYDDVTDISDYSNPARNGGVIVCHNRENWIRYAEYACRMNQQYVEPESGNVGNYVGRALDPWMYPPLQPVVFPGAPQREWFGDEMSFVDHADRDLTTGLHLANVTIQTESCPTRDPANHRLLRIECCTDTPKKFF